MLQHRGKLIRQEQDPPAREGAEVSSAGVVGAFARDLTCARHPTQLLLAAARRSSFPSNPKSLLQMDGLNCN